MVAALPIRASGRAQWRRAACARAAHGDGQCVRPLAASSDVASLRLVLDPRGSHRLWPDRKLCERPLDRADQCVRIEADVPSPPQSSAPFSPSASRRYSTRSCRTSAKPVRPDSVNASGDDDQTLRTLPPFSPVTTSFAPCSVQVRRTQKRSRTDPHAGFPLFARAMYVVRYSELD